ncbi:hypothetical protein IE996_14730 [Klebsiella pneumoniae]|uniref:Uncharacterized protein n=1 Tax=Klebsiella pneumoniae TaxID=573 RepID=A0A927DIN7_KLEPN|nr:hypothetical protein [Klebsiella pneumoniae]MBD3709400.1 hypothetical protein [Klebsiella pneumoniae]
MHPGNYPYSLAQKAVVDIHGGKLARVYTNGNGNRCRVTSADIELIPDASGVTYFAADKTLVTGCSWLNPASGATYPRHIAWFRKRNDRRKC